MTQQPTFYDEVGGHETFDRLVHRFYQGVRADPELRALYPEELLEPAEERLRMRHHPFEITFAMRDRWLHHMREALDELDLAPAHELLLWDYLQRAAHSLVNTPG